MVVMVVAIALFGRLAQAPRMAGAIGSCMHTASSVQWYQGLGHVRKGQSQPLRDRVRIPCGLLAPRASLEAGGHV